MWARCDSYCSQGGWSPQLAAAQTAQFLHWTCCEPSPLASSAHVFYAATLLTSSRVEILMTGVPSCRTPNKPQCRNVTRTARRSFTGGLQPLSGAVAHPDQVLTHQWLHVTSGGTRKPGNPLSGRGFQWWSGTASIRRPLVFQIAAGHFGGRPALPQIPPNHPDFIEDSHLSTSFIILCQIALLFELSRPQRALGVR